MAKNAGLKRSNELDEYTPERIQELAKCASDPIYFMENYLKVQHPVRGSVPFQLYDYQKEMVLAIHENRSTILLCSRQMGKCVTGNTQITIKSSTGIKNLSIQELALRSDLQNALIDGPDGKLKFTAVGKTDLLIETPSGWSKIKRVLKTIPYKVWQLKVEDLDILHAADNHLIMTEGGERYLKSLKPGELVQTFNGLKKVEYVNELDLIEEMYDLEIDDSSHVYYTNGILSHNTTVAAMYILWFATFNAAKRCVIASKAMNHAVEIMSRIKFAYEELPNWIKGGCTFYNRTSIEFTNKSVIVSEATSEKTGRGSSPSIIFLDEIAFISNRIQEEMWGSLTPALSTGGKFIITSTPNGDSDLFATLWRGANAGTNSFKPLQFLWWRHPDRDQAYYDDMVGKLGAVRAAQELDCQFLSSDALLISSVKLFQLRFEQPLWESMGFKFWVPEEQLGGKGKIYLVGLDPATGTGSDFSVIEIFEFPSLNQIGEFRSNEINIPLLYAKLSWILKKLSANVNGGIAEVLWTFERNGIGEAISALYFNDEHQVEEADLMNDHPSKFGVYTTGKVKILSCLQLKTMVEKINGGLNIKSEVLLNELKNFVAKGGGYEAKSGSTDDAVMATVLIMRLIKRLSEYNEEAFSKVNEYVDANELPAEDSDAPLPIMF